MQMSETERARGALLCGSPSRGVTFRDTVDWLLPQAEAGGMSGEGADSAPGQFWEEQCVTTWVKDADS